MSEQPPQDGQRFTSVVLAASRGPEDPVARLQDVSHKCLVEVGGRPMLLRVVDTLRDNPRIGRIAISIDRPEILDDLPGIADDPQLTVLRSGETPSRSVLDACADLASPFPLLVTTADNALLSQGIVDAFCDGLSATASDVAVGLAARTTIEATHPEVRRTYLRFRDDGYSGCNLFAISSEDGLRAIHFWSEVERHRKNPIRLIAAFGPVSLLLFLLRRLTLDAAMRRAGRRLGVRAAAVVLPFATAAIDVDKPSDLALAERLVAADGA